MSDATIERVRTLASRLGYRPNVSARELRLQRAEAVGVLWGSGITPTETSTGAQAFVGITRELEGHHYQLSFVLDDLEEAAEGALPKILAEHCVAGVIAGGQIPAKLVSMIEQSGLPSIFLYTAVSKPHDCVVIDQERIGALAAEYLHGLGHRDIAYVTNLHERNVAVGKRQMGYLKCMMKLGLRARDGYDRVQAVESRIEELFREKPYPTALATFDDRTAMLSMRALRACGIGVPEDVSVVGVNDLESATWTTPQLTTIRVPFAEMGAAAGRLMCEKLRTGGPVLSVTLHGTVIERESAGPLRNR